jgi:Gluconate 2-dehydrogenase subunit 3
MERRNAIKAISLSLGSLISLPAWASSWQSSTLVNASLSTSNEAILLAELVETIIPTTETLGAKGLGVHEFIQTMLADCYTKKAQENFAKNLVEIDPLSIKTFGKAFVECDATQRLNILQLLADSTDKNTQDFYKTLRGLTIQGYKSSEYYMTKFTDYEMAPARFYGCVPVKTR